MRACPGLASRHRVVVMFAGCATSVLALYTMGIVGCGAIDIYICVWVFYILLLDNVCYFWGSVRRESSVSCCTCLKC